MDYMTIIYFKTSLIFHLYFEIQGLFQDQVVIFQDHFSMFLQYSAYLNFYANVYSAIKFQIDD